jgi:aminoglycoside/choline kinase family phosphotransferase
MIDIESLIFEAFRIFLASNNFSIKALPPSGSNRKYFRAINDKESYIGVYNTDYKENVAFINFSEKFHSLQLPVPEILYKDLGRNIYIITDLGDNMLLSTIQKNENGRLLEQSINYYKQVIDYLPFFQIKGAEVIDFSLCYPRQAFDRQSIMWDLNYFKYNFLKLANVPFDEQNIEDDFNVFTDFLLEADRQYFLYRDFQSRNIMIYQNKPYFIDYQGGRKGALQYDIASLLFEAKTFLHPGDREELLNYYLNILDRQFKLSINEFLKYYYGYVYVRTMQAMGTYGFRGLYEKKELFLQSIPLALEHLKWLRSNVKLPVSMPELEKVWDYLIANENIKNVAQSRLPLTLKIISFSYKKGLPMDNTNHGGGFVFDCRALPNPGKIDEYRSYNGKDEPVRLFLESQTATQIFYAHVWSLVSNTLNNYLERGFDYLSVAFGCTGGQHRSVYFAEKLADNIRRNYPNIHIDLIHRELEE